MTTTSDPESALRRAGEALYAAFSHYRGLPHWGDACDMTSPADDFSVVRQPVRALERRLYCYYGWKAVTINKPGKPALKYFFPRVLYEAAFPPGHEPLGNEGPINLEMYIHDMNQGHWRDWPDLECDAIVHFFQAWLTAALARTLPPFAPESFYQPERYGENVLQFAAFLSLELGPLLASWTADQSTAATSQLMQFLSAHCDFIATHATLDRWDRIWGDAGANVTAIRKVVQFLTSAESHSRLERAFFATENPGLQKELAAAVDLLRNIYEIWNRTLAGTGEIPPWAEEIAARMCGRG